MSYSPESTLPITEADNSFALLSSRKATSLARLNELRSTISCLDSLADLVNLCIYVTGSFGRLEASQYSDLDLFFVATGHSRTNAIGRISKILLDPDLIRTLRQLNFPEFSNDAEYLSIHYLDDIKDSLGGREDDFQNYFTARLLLLLESRPLHNDETYRRVIEEIIQSYYRDYHDHESGFLPVFLINDIIRFWRTLCLNYEHRRNRPADDEIRRNKSHLDNLKLKFSRLLICHSTIALLSINHGVLGPQDLLKIVRLAPLERLDRIAEIEPDAAVHVADMKARYSWFLEQTGHDRSEVLAWISDSANRKQAFDSGRDFAREMYSLLRMVTSGTDIMRYLVV